MKRFLFLALPILATFFVVGVAFLFLRTPAGHELISRVKTEEEAIE